MIVKFKGKKKRHLIQHRNFVMLKILKLPTLFETIFPKNFHCVKTENYQTLFYWFLRSNSKIFDAARKFIFKKIALSNDNHVAIAILSSKGHVDVLIHFVIKPCTLYILYILYNIYI